jgi:hypothetical protein
VAAEIILRGHRLASFDPATLDHMFSKDLPSQNMAASGA